MVKMNSKPPVKIEWNILAVLKIALIIELQTILSCVWRRISMKSTYIYIYIYVMHIQKYLNIFFLIDLVQLETRKLIGSVRTFSCSSFWARD